MKMNITQHCNERMDKRGRRTSDIRVILKYGDRRQRRCLMTRRCVNIAIRRLRRWLSRHTAVRFQRRAEQVRAIIRLLERAANWMVVAADERDAVKVITVFRAGKSQRRKFAETAANAA